MSDSARLRHGRRKRAWTRKKVRGTVRKSGAVIAGLFVVFGTAFGSGAFATGEIAPVEEQNAVQNVSLEEDASTLQQDPAPVEETAPQPEPEPQPEAEPDVAPVPSEQPEKTSADPVQPAEPVESAPKPPTAPAVEKTEAKDEPVAEEEEEQSPSMALMAQSTPGGVCSNIVWPGEYSTVTDPLNDNVNDTYYQQGEEGKLGTWQVTTGSDVGGGQFDIGNVFFASDTSGGGADLYIGVNKAEAKPGAMYIELNKLPNTTNSFGTSIPDRSAGDIRLAIDWDKDGARSITLETWNDTTKMWTNPTTVTDTTSSIVWCGTGTYSEFKFDLRALLGGEDFQCRDLAFQYATIRTASSISQSSNLKDYASGAIDLDFCGSLKIKKTDEDGNLIGPATFKITPNPIPKAPNPTELVIVDNGPLDEDNTLGIISLVDINAGTYTVTETVPPPGYLLPKPAERSQEKTIAIGEDVTFTFKDPKKWDAPTVAKSVTAKYDVTYAWSIEKSVTPTEVQRIEFGGDPAQFTYEVVVTQGAETKSNYRLGGEITVTNPNDKPMVVTLSDELMGDTATCTIDATDVDAATPGLQVQLAKNADSTFSYSCEASADNAAGTNKATVTWSNAQYPSTQSHVDDPANAGQSTVTDEVDYESTEDKVTNREVNVYDQFESEASVKLNDAVLVWSEQGKTHKFTYPREIEGAPGDCTEYTNVATVVTNDPYPKTLDQAEATVEVCTTVGVSWQKVDENDHELFLGGSEWTISKVDEDGNPIVDPEGNPMTWPIEDCVADPCDPLLGDLDPAEGKFLFKGLTLGDYVLTETKAPTGYQAADPYPFSITGDNAKQVIDLGQVENIRKPGDIAWEKVEDFTDEDGNRLHLAGTTWKLVDVDGNEMQVADCVADTAAECVAESDKDHRAGYFLVTDLPWGTYTLTEVSRPDGYVLWTGSQKFVIDADWVSSTDNEIPVFENQRIPGEVTWEKLHKASNSHLGGSEWKLTYPDGSTETIEDCESTPCDGMLDQDPRAGYFKLEGLAWGEYSLLETKAPAGYKLPDPNEPIPFQIGPKEPAKLVWDLGQIDNQQQDVPALPLTGGVGAQIFLIGGGVLAALAIAYEIRRTRRNAANVA